MDDETKKEIKDMELRMRHTRREDAEDEAKLRLLAAEKAANDLLEVAAEEARKLITEAALRARDLLAVAVTKARELIQKEQELARYLI